MGDRDLRDPYGFEKFHGETQQSRSKVPLLVTRLFRKPGSKILQTRPVLAVVVAPRAPEALKRRRRLTTEAQNTRVIVEYSTSGILDTM